MDSFKEALALAAADEGLVADDDFAEITGMDQAVLIEFLRHRSANLKMGGYAVDPQSNIGHLKIKAYQKICKNLSYEEAAREVEREGL
jgi:hypothetical protein